MKIISFNVNGIRAAIGKGVIDWLSVANPDVFCAQEIKALQQDIPIDLFIALGYKYFVINPAQKKGYSGVAVFSKYKIDFSSLGINNSFFDTEGRVIRADIGSITIVCAYIPSGTSGDERQKLKMQFLDFFYDYINNLKQQRPNLLICGDYNICHKPIDINRPEKHEDMSGFLPEERQWFDKFISNGLVDSFRVFNQQSGQYTWWSYRAGAKAKNLGWRIDYHIVSNQLKNNLLAAKIHSDTLFSDHCPISVVIDDCV